MVKNNHMVKKQNIKYKYSNAEIKYKNKMKVKHAYTKLLKYLRSLSQDQLKEKNIQFYIKNCIKQLKDYEK